MRFPPSYYQIEDEIATYFPGLRPAQVSCLALWVIGRLLSGSCLQTKVVSALSAWAHADALRQRLREGLYDGRDRAAPCATQIEVEVCWPWLFAWVCALWDGGRLPLALDPTYERDRLVSVSLSVLYRGGAVSVAAVVLPANRKGDGLPDLLRVLEAFEGVPRPRREILVMTDRGLWSPALWSAFRRLGWHPIMRVHQGAAFRPEGGRRFRPAREWAGGAGRLFVRGGTPVRAARDALPEGQEAGRGDADRLLGSGGGRAVGALHRPRAGSGDREVVRAALLDRGGVPLPQELRLGVGADAAHRPQAGGPALAGDADGDRVGAGVWDATGGCRGGEALAGPAEEAAAGGRADPAESERREPGHRPAAGGPDPGPPLDAAVADTGAAAPALPVGR